MLKVLENTGINRYKCEINRNAPIAKNAEPNLDPKWDYGKNDTLKSRARVLRKFLMAGTMVIIKNRMKDRLHRI